jgi:glucose-6-phosphate 1-dehydrogenase
VTDLASPKRAPRRPPRGVTTPDDHVVVLFGATGDLARRKLLPGLWHLAQTAMLPAGYRIVGASEDALDDEAFRGLAREAVDEHGTLTSADGDWDAFARRLTYVAGAFGPGSTAPLARAVRQAEADLGGARRLFFFAVPPAASGAIVRGLGESGLADGARVLMEKPFGEDLASAQALNGLVHSVLDERQVFRIDHFLGKEGIQNVLALRFANGIFEPVWNREHIDHIQVDFPETLGVDQRVGFYDATGAFRDMVVTHLLQLLGFVAMDPPASIKAGALAAAKLAVFRSLRPLDPAEVVRGQYAGYEAPDSDTETLVALVAHIDNPRWDGVPVFIRTGKRMAADRKLMTIAFHEPPRLLLPFADVHARRSRQNRLTFDFDERGGITIDFLAKRPGAVSELERAAMQFGYESLGSGVLEAYERLFHDAMIGDRTLFTAAPGIERLWEVAAPLLASPPPVQTYPQGGWGPEPAVQELVAPRRWALSS